MLNEGRRSDESRGSKNNLQIPKARREASQRCQARRLNKGAGHNIYMDNLPQVALKICGFFQFFLNTSSVCDSHFYVLKISYMNVCIIDFKC